MSYPFYDTPFNRILRMIDYYLAKAETHTKNLVLVVNEELHLVQSNLTVHASMELYFLFNLASEPYKASQIMKKMKSVLESWNDVVALRNESEDFYFELMSDAVAHNFRDDTTALIYVDRLVQEISNVIGKVDTIYPTTN